MGVRCLNWATGRAVAAVEVVVVVVAEAASSLACRGSQVEPAGCQDKQAVRVEGLIKAYLLYPISPASLLLSFVGQRYIRFSFSAKSPRPPQRLQKASRVGCFSLI